MSDSLEQGETSRRTAVAVLAGLTAVFAAAWLLLLPFADGAVHAVVRWGLDVVVYAAAAGACLLRSLRVRQDRLTWALLGAAISVYLAGTVILGIDGAATGAPTASHVAWLAFYPLAYAGVVLLARATLRPFTLAFALDGVIVALALGAGVVYVTASAARGEYSAADVAAGLSYPSGDLLLFGFTLWAAFMAGWRTQPAWRWLSVAFGLLLVADLALIVQAASIGYGVDAFSIVAYPLAMVAIGVAAWQPPARARGMRPSLAGLLVLPAAAVLAAIVLLILEQASGVTGLPEALALAVLLLAAVRMVLVYGHLAALQESERFRQGFDEAAVGMAILDADLRWVRANDALGRLAGVSARQLGGASLNAVLDTDHGGPAEALAHTLATGEPTSALDGRVLRPDGTVVEVELTGALIHDERGDPQVFAQVRDVTVERKADRWAAAVARLTRMALDESNAGVVMRESAAVVAQAVPARSCTIVVAGDRATAHVAASAGTGAPDAGFASRLGGQTAVTLETGEPVIRNDTTTVDPDPFVPPGTGRVLSVPVRPAGRPPGVLAVHRAGTSPAFGPDDVRFLEAVANVLASAQERAAAEAKHRHQALHDPLTGLANRTLLSEHLAHALAGANRRSGSVALLLVDLDRFKAVNDTLGHRAGDELLRVVGDRLRERAREGDLVARLGGDEFVVVFDDVATPVEVVHVARRLLEAVGSPVRLGDRELLVSASVGVVVADDGAADPDAVLRDADVAMYRAKAGGGGRYELFDAALRAQVVDRLGIESALRQAIAHDELLVHLQPLIDLRERQPIGFEALVRWDRPETGVVGPGEFIDIAEETGLVVPLGAFVLQEACAQVAELNRRHGRAFRVSVNVSGRQITEDLITTVRAALGAAGLPPALLTVEITESLLIEDVGAPGVLGALRDLGVELALDDFGTGYSSLGALQDHAVDLLKLDRSMVATIATSNTAGAIARAAVDMAAALGLETVAEGIEDEAQVRAVCELGCGIGQGYLFGRPMPVDAVPAWLGAGEWTARFPVDPGDRHP